MRSRYWDGGEQYPALTLEDQTPEQIFDMIRGFARRLVGYEVRYKCDGETGDHGVSIVFIYCADVGDEMLMSSVEGTSDEMGPFVTLMNRAIRSLLESPGVLPGRHLLGICAVIASRSRSPESRGMIGLSELFYPGWEEVRSQMIKVLSGTIPFPM